VKDIINQKESHYRLSIYVLGCSWRSQLLVATRDAVGHGTGTLQAAFWNRAFLDWSRSSNLTLVVVCKGHNICCWAQHLCCSSKCIAFECEHGVTYLTILHLPRFQCTTFVISPQWKMQYIPCLELRNWKMFANSVCSQHDLPLDLPLMLQQYSIPLAYVFKLHLQILNNVFGDFLCLFINLYLWTTMRWIST